MLRFLIPIDCLPYHQVLARHSRNRCAAPPTSSPVPEESYKGTTTTLTLVFTLALSCRWQHGEVEVEGNRRKGKGKGKGKGSVLFERHDTGFGDESKACRKSTGNA